MEEITPKWRNFLSLKVAPFGKETNISRVWLFPLEVYLFKSDCDDHMRAATCSIHVRWCSCSIYSSGLHQLFYLLVVADWHLLKIRRKNKYFKLLFKYTEVIRTGYSHIHNNHKTLKDETERKTEKSTISKPLPCSVKFEIYPANKY